MKNKNQKNILFECFDVCELVLCCNKESIGDEPHSNDFLCLVMATLLRGILVVHNGHSIHSQLESSDLISISSFLSLKTCSLSVEIDVDVDDDDGLGGLFELASLQ